jgi:hypothetical protein
MVFLSVIMSLFIAIQDPIIQKFAIRIAGGYLSSKTGTEVQIGSLNISPNFTVNFDDVIIKDLKNNDLLNVKNLKIHPYMEELIHGDIHLERIELNQASAQLVTYEGEDKMNLQFLIDAFASDKEKTGGTPPIRIDRILVNGLDFQFWNQNKDNPAKGEQQLMDYAHIDVKDINLDLEGLLVKGDSITGKIHHLSAKEQSGFELKRLASQVNVSSHGILLDGLQLETPNSQLDLDLHMLYPGYHAFGTFVDSVTFDTRIRPTQILLSDLGPFTKVLYQMPDTLRFEGLFQGPIEHFEVNEMQFDFGKETHFEGNLAMHPLDFFDGKHELTIERMRYSLDDLSAFYIPGKTGTIPLPEIIAPMEKGTIRGHFEGSYRNFQTRLLATSEVGAVSASVKKKVDESGHNVFESTIDGEELNIGALVHNPKLLGNTDVSAHVTGKQRKNGGLELDIDGDIYNAELLDNTLNQISMNGKLNGSVFNGEIGIDDDELALDFKGRLDFTDPKAIGGTFQADITKADLNKLNLIKDDPAAKLRASIIADGIHLNDFNKAEGLLAIRNMTFENSKGTLDMDALDASIANDNLMQKKIQVNCDFLEFEMAGKMDFPTLVTAFKQTIASYAEIPQWTEDLEAFEKSGKSSDQDFIVNLIVKDPKPLTQLFVPDLSIAKNTTLNGTFTSRSRLLNLTLRSKSIRFNNFRINNIECKSASTPRQLITRLNLDQIILRDSTEFDSTMIAIDRFTITNTLFNDSIRTDLSWDDKEVDDHNKAFVSTYFFPDLEGGAFTIHQADILVNDSMWHLRKDGYVDFEDGKVRFKDIQLSCNEQRMSLNGMMPNTAEDTLALSFDQFDLSTLDFIFRGMGFDLDGMVYGNATVSDMKNDLSLIADMEIRQLGFNGETYGDAEIHSHWDHLQDAILLDVGLRNQDRKALSLTGGYYTKKKDDNLDFSLNVDSLSLSMISPFVRGVAERIQGYCKGDLTITGSTRQPELQGAIRVFDGGCKINFLNTFYTFSPTIELTDRLINLSDMVLTDTLGNSALVFGRISHDHLKNMRLNFKMFPDNFLAMATTADLSPKFFGNAIASGMVEVNGPVNDLRLDINALTRKGTMMTIPLGGKNSVSKHEFITFVNKNNPIEEAEEATEKAPSKQKGNLHLGIDLDVNDNAQIRISLPNNLGTLEAKGNGNIKLGMESNVLSLIGDYVIKNGSLSLNIEDLLRRNFILEEGSRISWTGDPVNGTIDVTGVYQTKTSLSTLGLGDSLNSSNNTLKAECLVHLKNRLMNPDITFGFRFPGASDELQQAIFSVIDTTNQAEVLMQSIYLMVMNSFNYSGSSNYYGFFTGQINDFLSQLTNDLDINFNYRPGDEYSNEEMTIALKKQLFDDRVTIETNFGVTIPTNSYASSSTNIIGDVNVDIKLTKDGRLSAQVFNRSNYNTYYYQYSYYKMAPYTQGIGLSYGRSFDQFKDLFKKRRSTPISNRPLSNRTEALGPPDPASTQQPEQDEPAQ